MKLDLRSLVRVLGKRDYGVGRIQPDANNIHQTTSLTFTIATVNNIAASRVTRLNIPRPETHRLARLRILGAAALVGPDFILPFAAAKKPPADPRHETNAKGSITRGAFRCMAHSRCSALRRNLAPKHRAKLKPQRSVQRAGPAILQHRQSPAQ